MYRLTTYGERTTRTLYCEFRHAYLEAQTQCGNATMIEQVNEAEAWEVAA